MKIYLFCGGGFSTSLLANKMMEAYKARGQENVQVDAMDFGSLESVIDEADIYITCSSDWMGKRTGRRRLSGKESLSVNSPGIWFYER